MTRAILLLAGTLAGGVPCAQAQAVAPAVSGRVFDDITGCPVAGAQVQPMSTSSHAVTNPRGRYRLSGIPGGEIVLQASRSGYRAQQTLPLTVSDSSVRIDFTLTRAIGDSASRAVYPPKPCHLEPADSSK